MALTIIECAVVGIVIVEADLNAKSATSLLGELPIAIKLLYTTLQNVAHRHAKKTGFLTSLKILEFKMLNML